MSDPTVDSTTAIYDYNSRQLRIMGFCCRRNIENGFHESRRMNAIILFIAHNNCMYCRSSGSHNRRLVRRQVGPRESIRNWPHKIGCRSGSLPVSIRHTLQEYLPSANNSTIRYKHNNQLDLNHPWIGSYRQSPELQLSDRCQSRRIIWMLTQNIEPCLLCKASLF